ncbi:MAG TPA: NAD-dependent epimerase/dehydratase family protein, partial [Actinomycetes bacterium]|nr:NAD-dependent epimerase/dehydratase family protein [Actinomycetes bacterium]
MLVVAPAVGQQGRPASRVAASPAGMRSMGAREKIAGMEILVTGAGGFVGGALAPELAGRGHVVRAATRDPGRYRHPDGIVPTRFD